MRSATSPTILTLALWFGLTLSNEQFQAHGFQVTVNRPTHRKIIFGSESRLKSASDNTNDPFDEFDPRNSPHSYPKRKQNQSNGTGSMDITKSFSRQEQKSTPQPTPPHDTYSTASHSTSDESVNTNASSETPTEEDPFALFDPRISPHMYPNGIEAEASSASTDGPSTSPKQIGILLIDHGSRKAASNELLEMIASIYQKSSKCPSHFVVKAAHMEIAPPSIEDVLKEFVIDGNIKQVICHPYFLSPGRHVTEDIPFLVEEAKQKILEMTGMNESELQIITTQHTGSRLNVMIDAISDIVEDSVKAELKDSNNDSGVDELGGFFGDVMKMMEQQIASEQV